MRYENEAGLTELALCHLGLSLLSKRRIHIKARQIFKVLHDLAPARLSNTFRNLSSANNYHLRNADNKLAVPWLKSKFLKKSFRLIFLFFPLSQHMSRFTPSHRAL